MSTPIKIAIGALGGFLVLIVLACLYVLTIHGSNLHNEEQLVYVPKGTGVSKIATLLEEKNVIDNVTHFKLSVRLFHPGATLKAGEYKIPENSSLKDVIDLLSNGETFQRYVTIPEGLTSYQVEKRLYTDLDIKDSLSADSFVGPIEEGSLLPDTYAYSYDESAADVLKRMQEAQTKVLDEAWENRAKDLPIKTKEEALILASIIEKETAVKSETRRVAGVFVNRLKRGMLLQTDPTVIYAITQGVIEDKGQGPLGRRLLHKDLEIDSKYNTYKYAGLPPGPICNPGAEAIRAALNPEEHDYVYFVADGSGGHAFSKTLNEHNNNVSKWRKIRNK
ncbi:MAG: aminodeoxychorismate lyase [Micavibrio sp.]|nr:aminodeoxychorismate lyase [Micavibrio sp.]